MDLHFPPERRIAGRTDLEARELRPGTFAFATAGSVFYVARGVTWQVRTQDPERAEVTAYQDGVWLGRANRARGRNRAERGAAGVGKWSGL